jgi:predicted GNAT family N-acyltransferase
MQYRLIEGKSEGFSLVMQVRYLVFVEEQSVPYELEQDEFDVLATHALVTDQNKPVATGRAYIDEQEPEIARLGRVAVLPEYRRQGIGRNVMNKLLEQIRIWSCKQVKIHAQLQVEKMYEKLGFKRCGSEFEEAGIMHVEMMLKL